MIQGIVLSGKQGVGKSTTSGEIEKILKSRGYTVYRMFFAEPVKAIGLEVLKATGVEITPDWKYKNRHILQAIGGSGREQNENMWANVLIGKFERLKLKHLGAEKVVVIVDDLRYKNEAEALRRQGFKLVRLEASPEQRATWLSKIGGSIVNSEHSSETSLDDYEFFDITIHQDSTHSPADNAARILDEIGL